MCTTLSEGLAESENERAKLESSAHSKKPVTTYLHNLLEQAFGPWRGDLGRKGGQSVQTEAPVSSLLAKGKGRESSSQSNDHHPRSPPSSRVPPPPLVPRQHQELSAPEGQKASCQQGSLGLKF